MNGKNFMNILLGLGGLLALGAFAFFLIMSAPASAPASGSITTTTTTVGGATTTTPGGSCLVPPASQTLAIQAYDADKPGTSLSPTSTVFLNSVLGSLNPGTTTTSPGSSYAVLVNKTGYFKNVLQLTTPLCEASVPVSITEKGVDTAISLAVYNSNGVTANTVFSANGTANQTITSGGGATPQINVVQSSNYKHLSGVTGMFAVFVNVSTQSEWAPSQMSVSFDNNVCPLLSSMPQYSQASPSAISGQLIISAVCTGDFKPQDGGSIHKLGVVLQANNGVTPATNVIGVSIAGIDYFQNTVSGAVQQGAVKDDGSAIQALQIARIYVN